MNFCLEGSLVKSYTWGKMEKIKKKKNKQTEGGLVEIHLTLCVLIFNL